MLTVKQLRRVTRNFRRDSSIEYFATCRKQTLVTPRCNVTVMDYASASLSVSVESRRSV